MTTFSQQPIDDTMATRDQLFIQALGTRIALARKAHHLTQKQLGKQLGVAQQTMAHYEGGRSKISVTHLPQLVRILHLTPDELLGLPDATRSPATRLEQQIAIITQLPQTQQEYVSQMLERIIDSSKQK